MLANIDYLMQIYYLTTQHYVIQQQHSAKEYQIKQKIVYRGMGKMRTCGLADLRTSGCVNCGPNLRTRSALYPLVGMPNAVLWVQIYYILSHEMYTTM